MQWFKHQADARHDPFIWDLRARFGAEGYFIYFATIEIYADSFKSTPGWFLDVSIDYLRAELGLYHAKKLLRVLDYIRSWPDVEHDDAKSAPFMGAHNIQASAPKWIAQLSGKRIALLIPAFVKIMDNYTSKKLRGLESAGGIGKGMAAPRFEQSAIIFRDIARDCETLATLPPKNGHKFVPVDFVGWCVKNDIHPGAIKDSTDALIKQWATIKDPWPWARGVVNSKVQHYKNTSIDPNNIKAIYGGFFKSIAG